MKKKNTEISERIKAVIDDLGLSPNAFALKLSYKRGQTVYDILNGKSAPSYDFFNRFMLSEFSATYSVDWLLTGRGDMYLPRIGTAMELGQTNILQQILQGSDRQIVYAPEFQDSALLKALEQLGAQIRDTSKLEGQLEKLAQINGELSAKAAMSDSYLERIITQAEEIGKLRNRIELLESRLEKSVSSANIGDTANVG